MPTWRSENPTLTASPSALSPARVWWLAARPVTLAASVSPVLAAIALTLREGAARPWAAAAAAVVAIAMQVGVNYANDYSDFARGADQRRVGPLRAASSGVVSPDAVKIAAFLSFGVAAAVGLALSLATDWRLIFAGIAAVLAGWLYTCGPKPYGYLGLGEVFTFTFFGLLATAGTVFVVERAVPVEAWLLAVAMGCLPCAILAVNNLRDVETDRAAGKMTLAVRLGRGGTKGELALLLAVPYLIVLALALRFSATAVLPLLSLPLAVSLFRLSASASTTSLLAALRQAAALEVIFALLWALGMLL